jgi:hypothetical protein
MTTKKDLKPLSGHENDQIEQMDILDWLAILLLVAFWTNFLLHLTNF